MLIDRDWIMPIVNNSPSRFDTCIWHLQELDDLAAFATAPEQPTRWQTIASNCQSRRPSCEWTARSWRARSHAKTRRRSAPNYGDLRESPCIWQKHSNVQMLQRNHFTCVCITCWVGWPENWKHWPVFAYCGSDCCTASHRCSGNWAPKRPAWMHEYF